MACTGPRAYSRSECRTVWWEAKAKPDIASGIARQWFDEQGVDVVLDVPNSAVALAVTGVVQQKDKGALISGAGTADLTGPRCSPNTVHWTFDTWMLARSNGGTLVQSGRKTWFFLTADYAFGQALQRDASAFIEQAGGKVLGSVAYPFPQTTADVQFDGRWRRHLAIENGISPSDKVLSPDVVACQ